MAEETNPGASYLLALKRASASPTGAATAATSARESGAEVLGASSLTQATPEQRRSPRYKCEGSAEMRQEGYDTRAWATFTDISLHGCYVECPSTYPVGTILHMKLEANGVRMAATGNVRVSYPGLGMGLGFIHISEENRLLLRDLLRSISRPSVILGTHDASLSASMQLSASLPPVTNAQAALQALLEFFDQRQLLTREEFARLLRKSQQPGSSSQFSPSSLESVKQR
jgi:hypothetical protein